MMRPETNGPWRKTLRREARGVKRGRHQRRVETEPPRRGSTWPRRHLWMPDWREVWQQRLPSP